MTTTERLLRNYNTYSRRATVAEQGVRTVIFNSLRRTLGPWLPQDRNSAILDVACGEGALLSFLCRAGYSNLSGFDISPENVAICHQLGLTFVRELDALRLGEMGDTQGYDTIFALDILEHLPKERAAGFLEHLWRLLLPGGSLIVQTPNMGSLGGAWLRYGDLSHHFGLTETSAVSLMMIAGFTPERIEVRPAWNATTALGRLREGYLWLLHHAVWLAEGTGRPKVPTKNLLIRGSVP